MTRSRFESSERVGVHAVTVVERHVLEPEAAVGVDALDAHPLEIGERRRAAGEPQQLAQRDRPRAFVDAGTHHVPLDANARAGERDEHHVAGLQPHVLVAVAGGEERIEIESRDLVVGAQHADVAQAAERVGPARGDQRVQHGGAACQRHLARFPHRAEHEDLEGAHASHRHLDARVAEHRGESCADEAIGVGERQAPQGRGADPRQEHLPLAIQCQRVRSVRPGGDEHEEVVARAQDVVRSHWAVLDRSLRTLSQEQVAAEQWESAPTLLGRGCRHALPQVLIRLLARQYRTLGLGLGSGLGTETATPRGRGLCERRGRAPQNGGQDAGQRGTARVECSQRAAHESPLLDMGNRDHGASGALRNRPAPRRLSAEMPRA